MSNPLIGQVRPHPTYRDCSFVVTQRGSANFFGPDHRAEAEAFAKLVNGAVPITITKTERAAISYDDKN